MTPSIRRLGPGDEAVLALLAVEDADFDFEGRSGPLRPLESAAALRYLANPAVLHWVAVEDDTVTGFLYCLLVPLRSGKGQEVLLYEIGVRRAFRRCGTGRALLTHLEEWMRTSDAEVIWVLADNEVAVEFYRGCGFSSEDPQPVYMIRELPGAIPDLL